MDGQRSSEVNMTVHFRGNQHSEFLKACSGLTACLLLLRYHLLLPLPRYLLPALCHLSAEEGPRKVLLTLDTPALLVDFLSRCWTAPKGRSGVASARDPSMETACSALLNFTVTEPERVR